MAVLEVGQLPENLDPGMKTATASEAAARQ
jgi:hypothetical protein